MGIREYEVVGNDPSTVFKYWEGRYTSARNLARGVVERTQRRKLIKDEKNKERLPKLIREWVEGMEKEGLLPLEMSAIEMMGREA